MLRMAVMVVDMAGVRQAWATMVVDVAGVRREWASMAQRQRGGSTMISTMWW